MRQKEDKQFADLLNRLREGNHSVNDIAILRQRILNQSPENSSNYPINMTHMFSTNALYDITDYLSTKDRRVSSSES